MVVVNDWRGTGGTPTRRCPITHAADKTGATVFGHRVKDAMQNGVVQFDASGRAFRIEEKPALARSTYAVTDLCFFDASACDSAAGLRPSSRGALEIADVNIASFGQDTLTVEILGCGVTWLDTGSHQSLLQTSQTFVMVEQRQGPRGDLSGGSHVAHRLDRLGAGGAARRTADEDRGRAIRARHAD